MSTIDIIFLSMGMGLLGSIHCMGMCGPLVLGIFKDTLSSKPYNYFLYHFGKLMAYGTLGFGFGLLGKSLHLFISQQQLSILTGALLLLYYIINKMSGFNEKMTHLSTTTYNRIKTFTNQMPLPKFYLLGFLNGFLPCGLVYLAATSSIATGHVLKSILWMVGFGIGTIPSLTLILWLSRMFQSKFNPILSQIYQQLTLVLAVLLILRGLNLGIPYISPKYNPVEEKVSKCCHR